MREIDQRICELLRVRKIEGMELLFKEYYKPLVVWGATFVSDVQRSEDIVQDKPIGTVRSVKTSL